MPQFTHTRYNLTIDSPQEPNNLEWELKAYKHEWPIEKGGLGPVGHFKKIVEILFGEKSDCPFVWNPWSEKMIDVFHEHPITKRKRPHIGVSGCANSSKSHTAALYGLINWLCSPSDTFVFITSTSISDSKHRVWKSVRKLFESVKGLPGNLVDSQAQIRVIKADGKSDDSAGIFIVAGHPSKSREGVGKIIGRKNARVFLIADELPELSPSILDAGFGNLSVNDLFQFIGMGNFNSREDAFGELIEPVGGWESINVNSDEWECLRNEAYCLRFDGLKSPNIIAGKDIYPQIYGSKQLRDHRASFGENTGPFMRNCRSFETGIGDENTIYSESDFTTGRVFDHVIWAQGYTKVAGCDPSFTNGGDRFVIYFGKYGLSTDGVWTLLFDEYKVLREDIRKINERNRSYQMADQIKLNCEERGVLPKHFGLDATATGGPFADVVEEVWSRGIYRVDFSGSPTERIATADGKTAEQSYDRRVTEIWYVGKEFLKGHQIRGLHKDAAREAKARKYTTVKTAEGLKMKAETKPEMKERLRFSPDIIEAGFVMVDLCRERLGFVPTRTGNLLRANTSFRDLAKQMNRVYTGVAYAA